MANFGNGYTGTHGQLGLKGKISDNRTKTAERTLKT